MREDHVEALRLHHECYEVEKALKKQTIGAIDKKFTKCLKNRTTQRVDMILETLFTTLFRCYGFITQ